MEPASNRTSPSTFLRSSSCSRPTSTCGCRQCDGRFSMGCLNCCSVMMGSLEADMRLLLRSKALGVSAFKFESDARTREIGIKLAVCRLRNSVKEHVLDADVVVKVLKVAERNGGA